MQKHSGKKSPPPALRCAARGPRLLRLEAGMPLYGHEIDREHSPVAAGLTFAVGKKGGYIGAEALAKEMAEGSKAVLVGLKVPGKRPAREGYAVLHEGEEVGVITSGMFSPLDAGIAMAYVTRPQQRRPKPEHQHPRPQRSFGVCRLFAVLHKGLTPLCAAAHSPSLALSEFVFSPRRVSKTFAHRQSRLYAQTTPRCPGRIHPTGPLRCSRIHPTGQAP